MTGKTDMNECSRAIDCYTAGPWHFGKYADRVTATEDSDGTDSICHVYAGNQRANARLISAAPDLLEACEAYLRAMEEYGHPDKTDRMMRRAIEKAKFVLR